MNNHKLEALVQLLGRRPKLLIVDDVPSVILQVRSLFQDKCEIYMASNGDAALQLAQKIEPDVILLDINMPGMNGYSVCKRLSQDPQTNDIPVIILTSDAQELNEELAFELGAVDFIRKPLNPRVTCARTYTHLVNKVQSDLLRRASKLDGLTGLLNRVGLEESFAKVWLECMRKQQYLSILMIDIDFFKSYNDYFGHLAGDDCLKLVAKTIAAEAKRPLDCVARFGGEEFCCILPDTDQTGALKVAEAIRSAVHDMNIDHPKTAVPGGVVTVSIGLTSHIPSSIRELSTMLGYADSLLYRSKASGRNQISSEDFVTSVNSL